MTFKSGFGGMDRRRRGRVYSNLFKFAFLAGVVGVFSYWAFVLGGERAENENRDLRERVTLIGDENERLHNETEAAVVARVAAEERAAAFQRQYIAEVPQGPAKEIMAQVNKRLADGVSPKRMSSVVEAVRNETRCEPEVSSRRFILQTPFTTGSNASVSFSDNTITVGGVGAASRDAAGNAQSWFDPTQPVTITFTLIGGHKIEAAGTLPLHHSVVTDNVDHRFAITPAQTKGFVVATEQICEYP